MLSFVCLVKIVEMTNQLSTMKSKHGDTLMRNSKWLLLLACKNKLTESHFAIIGKLFVCGENVQNQSCVVG